MTRFDVIISTDGSCEGNPGPGGWAAIIKFGKHEKVVSGYKKLTTNNEMELTALVESVRCLTKPCNIIVRTDSQYVCTGLSNAQDWMSRGWRTKTGARCANQDLWQELKTLEDKGKHSFQFIKVKGHAGDPDNERCDELAKAAIRKGA